MRRNRLKSAVIAMLMVSLFAVPVSAEKSAADTKQTGSETKKEVRKVKVGDTTYKLREKENGTYYVTEELGLNVRALPDQNSERLGGLDNGESVEVTGFVYQTVKKDGKKKNQDTGWVEIRYQDATGYVRNELSKDQPKSLTEEKPSRDQEKETYQETEKYEEEQQDSYREEEYTQQEETQTQEAQPEYDYCAYCDEYYLMGSYHWHYLSEADFSYCGYCGMEYRTGDPAHNHSSEYATEPEQELYECPNCGGWYEAGNIFRNHICIY